jgi:hypothetical protein
MKKNMITKEQAKRLAEVAIAIAEGKRVTRMLNGKEVDVALDRSIIAAGVEYTIHEPPPEPKYRPWTLEEAVDSVGLRVRAKSRTVARLIGAAFQDSNDDEVMVHLVGMLAPVSAKFLLKECELFDGTPCGVRE